MNDTANQTGYVPVPALARGGRILAAVLEKGSASARELARQCPCPKTTFYRLLAELVHSGYLGLDPESGRYIPGPLFEGGFAAREEARVRLRELAAPVLEQLARDSGNTVKLNVASGRSCCVIALALGTQKIRILVDEGTRYPLHTGAAGKLLLAYQGEEAIRRYFQIRPERCTPLTVTDEARFQHIARDIRAQGYAFDAGEFTPQIGAVACPVRGPGGQVMAAVSIAYPQAILRSERLPELMALLREGTVRLSQRMQQTENIPR